MAENAAKKKGKDFNLVVPADAIRGTEIMKSGDYKYARVGAKIDEDTYVSVSYEWKGEGIPDAVMALMEYIQANKAELKEDKEELAKLHNRITAAFTKDKKEKEAEVK